MKNENYNSSITANVTPAEAFNSICKVTEWWSKNIDGKTEDLNDVFTYHPGDTRVTFKITEFNPDKKIVWHVTDCYLHWLTDKTEWTNTDVVFEIVEKGDATQITLTHIGLVPQVECYEGCVKGWNFFIGESLRKLITEGQGQPDRSRATVKA